MGKTNDLQGLRDVDLLRQRLRNLAMMSGGNANRMFVQDVFCPNCSFEQRMTLTLRSWTTIGGYRLEGPAFFTMDCLQCQTECAGVVHEGPEGDAVSLHWPLSAGLSTPNTPPGVAYYLDQAARCESAGAASAAAAMYRAALDHPMFNHGYEDGLLGKRLHKMIDDVAAGNGPKWAREIDHEFLDVIKKLGDGAIHTNDGDVSKQAVLDEEVLAGVQIAFAEILEVVYERPAKKAEQLEKLKNAAGALKK